MDPARWQQLQTAFAAVIDAPDAEREALIERLCVHDDALRAELRSLVAQWAGDPGFLESAPPAVGALDAPVVDELIGRPLGAWTPLHRIGGGGMGVVYLGERNDGSFEQYAAIKVIPRGMDSEVVLARFHAERRILAALDHPNIARIVDGGITPDGRPWFAMPYLEGAKPLDDHCDAHHLTLAQRLQLTIAVCKAVQFAHQNLVIHRDLKPANILVTPQGVPVLLDFGIAKLLDRSGEDLTEIAARVLTPGYASPEQLAGGTITTASDVYQLGVLLYKLLCGHKPHADAATLPLPDPKPPSARIDTEAACARGTTIDALRRQLRGDLDTICLHALRDDPQRRYRSAEALADDLSRHLRGLPVQARADTAGYRVGKFLRRHRWGVAFAATLFGVAIGFGLLASIAASRLAEQADAVRAERDRAQAIAGFMTDLFARADPTKSQLDLTAGEMLDRGLALLTDDRDLRDGERAAVLTAIGGVYQVRGDYATARTALREAVALGRDGAATGEPFAGSLLELSKLESRLGDHAASERLARESLEVLAGLPDDDPGRRASALNQLAVALSDLDRPAEAAAMLEEVVALRRAMPGADTDQNLAANLNNLGLIYVDLGRLDRAESAYDASLSIVERRFGREHAYAAFLLGSRSGLHEQRGDTAKARRDLEDALELAGKALGPEHPFVAEVLHRLGRLSAAQNDHATARAHFEQALQLQRDVLPPDHPAIAESVAALERIAPP